jgi:hypothetical protein
MFIEDPASCDHRYGVYGAKAECRVARFIHDLYTDFRECSFSDVGCIKTLLGGRFFLQEWVLRPYVQAFTSHAASSPTNSSSTAR